MRSLVARNVWKSPKGYTSPNLSRIRSIRTFSTTPFSLVNLPKTPPPSKISAISAPHNLILPPTDDEVSHLFADSYASSSSSSNSPGDSFISCTILDEKGNVTTVSQKFPKMQFLQQHGLYPRDLRKIDSSAIDIIPSIVIRDNCILVNLLHIKALVESNKVIIFDTSNTSAAARLGLFIYDLESKLKPSNNGWVQNYEHKALESILINVMTCLETELQQHLKVCGTILAELEDEIDRDKLRDLLIKSKSLSTFYQKTLLIRNVLDELLENDDDLSSMYLTKHHSSPENTAGDFGEIEMLLEAYYKQCDEFVQQSESLLSDIKATEEIVNIILDANRNSLMLFELKVTIYTLGFTIATLLPAFYGMNLKNFIEESNLGFAGIMLASVVIALLITSANFKTLRSVQKLTLMSPEESKRAQTLKKRQQSLLNNSRFPLFQKKEKLDPRQRDIIWKWLVDEKK